jgi:hypothetical protein
VILLLPVWLCSLILNFQLEQLNTPAWTKQIVMKCLTVVWPENQPRWHLEQDSFLQNLAELRSQFGNPLLVNPCCLQFASDVNLTTGEQEDKHCQS